MATAIGGATALRAMQQQSPTHSDELVEQLRSQLAGSPHPEVAASLEEKLRIAEESQRQERYASEAAVDPQKLAEKREAVAAEADSNEVRPGWLDWPKRPAGAGFIVDDPWQPPFPSMVLTTTNLWCVDESDGAALAVWAGRVTVESGRDPRQGELALVRQSTLGHRFLGFYPTPTKHGVVWVTGASGLVLELTAEDGTTFHFDVVSREFR
ncbi:MAG: hypothetical protein HY875_03115 [Chloroflexi bacterium]|nr:hypothetical protein [Chloroflexota bacterium]